MSTTGGPDLPPGDPDVLANLVAETPTHSEEAYVEAATASSRLSANSHLFDEADARRRHRLSYRSGLNPAAGSVIWSGGRRQADPTAPISRC